MQTEPQQKTTNIPLLSLMAFAAVIGAITGSVAMGIFFFPEKIFSSTKNVEQEVKARVVELIEEESATISVVNDVTPSVVSVIVKKPQAEVLSTRFGNGLMFRFSPQEDKLTQQQAEELVEVSSGTGFFVSDDGLLITNRHVVDEDNASYTVITNDGKEHKATLIDKDPFQDIAVLKVQGEGFHAATLGESQNIRIGQTVIAIGNSLSEFRNTVTKGVVSGIDRRVTASTAQSAEVIEKAIQTDAAINRGNSGGPLINLLGEVIGINTAVSSQGESVGFAIPIDQAKRVIDDVKTFGRIVRPWLGVRYVLVESKSSADAKVSYEVGAMITEGNQPGQKAVFDDSPASAAGLKSGDIVIAINDKNLTPAAALSERVSEFRPGDVIKITFLRDGEIQEVNLTLAEFKD